MRLSPLLLLGALLAACGSDAPEVPFDPEEIHLEILSPERAAETPRLLPIIAEGKRFATLRELRAWMRGRSDPDRYPSKTMADGETPRPPVYRDERGDGLYPSRRLLVVACDADTSFGWMKGLAMQACWMVGAPRRAEFRESPRLETMRVESRQGEKWLELPMPLYRFHGPSGDRPVMKLSPVGGHSDRGSDGRVVRWLLAEDSWSKATLVGVARRGADAVGFGSVRYHDPEFPGRVVALLRSWVKDGEQRSGSLDLEVHPEVAFAHVAAARALVAEAGWETDIELEIDDPLALLARLERGELR